MVNAQETGRSSTDPSIPPVPVDPVKVGDLLGATGSNLGSLLTINPADAMSTTRFPLGVGPVFDIEYDPVSRMVFVATFADPGSLTTIDPDTGALGTVVGVDSGSVIALEAAGDILYGVRLYIDNTDPDLSLEQYSLVSIDKGSLQFITEVPISRSVESLAYDAVDRVMYGVASGGTSGSELVRIDLTTGEIVIVGDPLIGVIAALDFSNDNTLYGVERSGILYKINDLTLSDANAVEEINPISATTGLAVVATAVRNAAISGLTFVVDEAPPVEPIKTICSSSLTSPMYSSSEPVNHKRKRFRLKRNPLRRGIGMFKFEGKANEILHLALKSDEVEPVESEENTILSWLQKLWPRFKPKNRVFVSLRDAIPGVKFRVKAKGVLPLVRENIELPADGLYYIMVIRPLRRFNQTDYCLTLESDNEDSQAWQTLQVAYPGDDTEENTTSTSTEAKTAEVQKDTGADEGSSGTGDTTPAEPAAVAPALTAAAPLSVAHASSAVEPVDEGSSQEEVKPAEETIVDETEEAKPEESADETTGDAETTDDSDSEEVDDDDSVSSEVDEEQPMLKGAPPGI